MASIVMIIGIVAAAERWTAGERGAAILLAAGALLVGYFFGSFGDITRDRDWL